MTQFQDVIQCLLAAGYTDHPEGEGKYLLYVDPKESSLISKHLTDSSFDDKELVATSVRPNSTAAYLIKPDTQLVICISSESTIRVLQYDNEEEEWPDVDTKGPHVVHPDGKLTAFYGADNILRIIFQDRSGGLVYLKNDFQPEALRVDSPVKGSPLSSAVVNDRIYVFYISARDKCIHYVTEARPGNWTDNILSKHAFEKGPKQFIVSADQNSGAFEAYVLTEENTLVRIANSKTSVLGKIDEKGNFTSTRSVDRCCNDAWNGTLTGDHLKKYLASDRSIIDTPGGDNSVTPLAAACWRGHLDIVKLLLHEGANPDAISPQNRTPLFYLTRRSPPRNRLDIVRALLDAGANVDKCYPENNLNTPLMNAIAVVTDKEVVHELLKRGASLTATNAQGQTAKMLARGTKVEADFLKWTEKTPSELEARLVEFLISLFVLIVTYFNNNEFVRNVFTQVMTEVMSRLDEEDSIDNEKYSFRPLTRSVKLTHDLVSPRAKQSHLVERAPVVYYSD